MRIDFLGDSTQVGVSVWAGVTTQAQWTPAKVVGAFLGAEVRNLGVGGQTMINAMVQPIVGGMTAPAWVAASDADLIVANWGINDAYIPGNTPAAHRARWEQLAAAAGGRLVMQTPNPINMPHGSILAGLVAEARKANCRRIDLHQHITTFYPNWQAHMSDGVHPNEIMYLHMGRTLADGLAAMTPPLNAP